MRSDQSPHSSPGRGMALFAWAGALLLLAWLFGFLLEQRFNPNGEPAASWQGTGAPQVVLQANADGHYVVGGRIDGRPVTLLVDTGATDVAVPVTLARQLDLPHRGGVVSQTANGTVAGWRTELASLRIGGILLRDVPATVLPDMGDGTVLLGMSALKHLELVQRDRQLTLRVPAG